MNSKTAISFQHVPSISVLQAAYPGTRALFFDMDGTLFDTEKYHAMALVQIGREFKIRAPISEAEVYALMVGKANYLLYEIIKDWEGFPSQWSAQHFTENLNQRVMQILQNTQRDAFLSPHILPLLNAAKKQHFFVGLVTSSEKVVTRELLKTAGLQDFFDLELTRDDCPAHKPDPWPYLEAMRMAQVSPVECIIFEDSTVGLTAALASGAHVIKVEWY
jgi:beta-phosphoglucomutase